MCHQMTIDALAQRDRRLAVQAMQADPLTGMVLTLPKIRALADELFAENAAYMKDWK
jgi:alpha-galactosidase/6-phospho-beta-glucosidase family protein